MDILVAKMEGKGTPAHKVWLDPLDTPPTLDELLPLATTSERGFGTGRPEQQGSLSVPVALIDKPFEQRRDVQWIDMAAAAGHVAVAGGAQSGKSTMLRTVMTSLAFDAHSQGSPVLLPGLRWWRYVLDEGPASRRWGLSAVGLRRGATDRRRGLQRSGGS